MKPPDPCHSMPPSPKSAAHETRLPLFWNQGVLCPSKRCLIGWPEELIGGPVSHGKALSQICVNLHSKKNKTTRAAPPPQRVSNSWGFRHKPSQFQRWLWTPASVAWENCWCHGLTSGDLGWPKPGLKRQDKSTKAGTWNVATHVFAWGWRIETNPESPVSSGHMFGIQILGIHHPMVKHSPSWMISVVFNGFSWDDFFLPKCIFTKNIPNHPLASAVQPQLDGDIAITIRVPRLLPEL